MTTTPTRRRPGAAHPAASFRARFASKTFVLSLLTLAGFFVMAWKAGRSPDGYEIGALFVGLAALVFGNDKGAAAREEAQTSDVYAETAEINDGPVTVNERRRDPELDEVVGNWQASEPNPFTRAG